MRNLLLLLRKYVTSDQRFFYLRLLLKFKGGIWSKLWVEFLIYLSSYVIVTVIYHFILFKYPLHRRNFESFLIYIMQLRNLVPLSFMLGFFVSCVISRWWTVISNVPRLSRLNLITNAHICAGSDPQKCIQVRQALMRYSNMAWIFAFLTICSGTRSRFCIKAEPDSALKKMAEQWTRLRTTSAVGAGGSTSLGSSVRKDPRLSVRQRSSCINEDPVVASCYRPLITEQEVAVLEQREVRVAVKKRLAMDYNVPLAWMVRLLQKSREEGLIQDSMGFRTIMDTIENFRSQLQMMFLYRECQFPLVYTQVVIFIVYSFVMTEIFAQQIDENKSTHIHSFDFQTYFPVLAILKYVLYMGWFNVGLSLIYPFDVDTPDMPLNKILDKNLRIGIYEFKAGHSYYPEMLRGDLEKFYEECTKMESSNDILLSATDDDLSAEEDEEEEVPNTKKTVYSISGLKDKLLRRI